MQHHRLGAGSVGLAVSTRWAVHFDNGEVHTYTKTQLKEKFGIAEVTLGMPVQHKVRGPGTAGVSATDQVDYSLEKFLAICKKKRSRFVIFRQKIRQGLTTIC